VQATPAIFARHAGVIAACLGLATLVVGGDARATGELPPWTDADDVPFPVWVHSVSPKRIEVPIYKAPGVTTERRGTPMASARLPLFGATRAGGCTGRWYMVGPMAWICSDNVNLLADPPSSPEPPRNADALPFRYFFVGKNGASGFLNLARALEDQPDQELEPGWAVGVSEERDAHGERWLLTNHGRWIAAREVSPAHPFAFEGAQLTEGKLDVGWVSIERANVYSASKGGKVAGTRVLRELVHTFEQAGQGAAAMVRVTPDDVSPQGWMRARDLIRPTSAPPPEEAGGATAHERWIDVDVQTQTLVAYDGTRPVFATMVSTGKGGRGSSTATRLGTHRIWVKLVSTNMGNLENEEADEHYSIEDVPWVQFFDKAIALHGAFWHRDFGHVHSHGCVNLAPRDAAWLFQFTGPHLPRGWIAALPTELEPGSVIRVR
jgi:hypothetical protein